MENRFNSLYMGYISFKGNKETYELFDSSNCDNKIAEINFDSNTGKAQLVECDYLSTEQVRDVLAFMDKLEKEVR